MRIAFLLIRFENLYGFPSMSVASNSKNDFCGSGSFSSPCWKITIDTILLWYIIISVVATQKNAMNFNHFLNSFGRFCNGIIFFFVIKHTSDLITVLLYFFL